MNKITKTILISSIAIFGAGILFISPTQAQPLPPPSLVVEFQNAPLFNEANFAPGESVSKWVKITNNSGSTQKIATEAINETDLDNLADKLNLVIKEGETKLYNNTLANFFAAGEKYLSDLTNGIQTQYDFTITFDAEANDDYQGKTLGFDILVGFQGQEGGTPPPTPLGGGTVGLTITNETAASTTETSVTITWTTSYFSTSQVIYGAAGEAHTLNLSDNVGTPPKYGYANTTPESDTSPKVTSHSVTIYGLTPGTTYYYRAVSHGSLAISQEHTFVTKGVAGAETVSSQEETGEILSETTGTEETQTGEEVITTEEPGTTEQTPEETPGETQGGSSWWIWLIIVLVIIAAYIFWTSRKK